MQIKILLLAALTSISITTHADTLKPFTTDGCSMFPDGNLIDDSKWVKCCIRHDLAYWKGGAESDRIKADDELQQCVEALGDKTISSVMRLGVKIGGAPVYPTWYRWGYGWPYSRGYKSLSKEELQQVNNRLKELRELINTTIESNE